MGIGMDWVMDTRTRFNASAVAERTRGRVAFAVQPGAVPATPAENIPNYDTTKRYSFNLKGTRELTDSWSITGGYAYEKYRFDDISYNDYAYTTGTGTSTSYLSGAYAFPEYTVKRIYAIGKYSF
jgi:hypothetical protein